MPRAHTRTIALVSSFIIAVGWASSSTAAQADTANVIPDDALRHCIAHFMQEAGVPFSASTSQDPTQVDVLTQADLDAFANATTSQYGLSCAGVTSIAGLDNLHDAQFTQLALVNGQLADLTPLTGLTELTQLSLPNNQVTDLTPLASLTGLMSVDLTHNRVDDAGPLTELTSLDSVVLTNNKIADLTPLTGLTKLSYLDVGDNQITGLKPLAGLTNLVTLLVSNNQITDLTPLSGLTNLAQLYTDGNQVSDLKPVSGLTALGQLCLDNNQITDLTPLSGLTNLTWLSIDNNKVKDLTPLAGLTKLQDVYVSNNLITDITPIATQLNQNCTEDNPCTWTLDGNQITNLTALNWKTVEQSRQNTNGHDYSGVTYFGARNQTTEQTANTGTTSLPTITPPAKDSTPLTWSVTAGQATINQDDGTVTYTTPGVITLAWTDTPPTTTDPGSTDSPADTSSDATASPQDTTFFSGTVQVTVTGPSAASIHAEERTGIIILVILIAALILAGIISLVVLKSRRPSQPDHPTGKPRP
ncbi:MAG: leucine-rich repeat domain-containing protein [Propionibacteriaceae bacterium]|nr:leucine-rich repeat domain-containing protein [Propionibacteriaceae bacterium]